jgi:uncharacterized membrane protein required for colicin V production
MFMAALPTVSTPPVNLFDGFVVIWLIVGIFRGRKRGMTQELLPTLQWMAIVVLAGLFYRPFSPIILQNTSGAFSRLWANVTAYVLIAFGIHLAYLWIKQLFGEKLTGSDCFGRAEYYLGMLAGLVRFACIIIVMCALMHSRFYTPAELAENENLQKKNLEGVRVPIYMTVQHAILMESFTGQFLDSKLHRLLIDSFSPNKKTTESLARKKEDTINAILGPAKK